MFGDGELWIPPDLVKDNDEDVLSDPDEEEARLANQAKGYLGLSGQQKFLWLLRGVDSRRGSVARGMAYAMRRADAAEEVLCFQAPLTIDCGHNYREFMFEAYAAS